MIKIQIWIDLCPTANIISRVLWNPLPFYVLLNQCRYLRRTHFYASKTCVPSDISVRNETRPIEHDARYFLNFYWFEINFLWCRINLKYFFILLLWKLLVTFSMWYVLHSVSYKFNVVDGLGNRVPKVIEFFRPPKVLPSFPIWCCDNLKNLKW